MSSTLPKKVYIKTYGLPDERMTDSDKMSDVMNAANGYEPTDDPEQADLILFNTCSIREKGAMRKSLRPGPRQAPQGQGRADCVGGCVASQEGAAIIERAPYVDVVFGPQTPAPALPPCWRSASK